MLTLSFNAEIRYDFVRLRTALPHPYPSSGVRSGIDPVQLANGVDCREGGIVEEYQLDNAVNNPHLVPELFSLEIFTLMKVGGTTLPTPSHPAERARGP